MKKFLGIIVNHIEGTTSLRSVQATNEMEAREKFASSVSKIDGDYLSNVYKDK